jgi:hypothetical protein
MSYSGESCCIIRTMGGTLLDRFLFSCWHQFSWPRRSGDGEYYQVCLRCGAEYQYDWRSMKRTSRRDIEGAGEAAPPVHRQSRKCGTKAAWTPRERRLKHEVEVLYRERGTTAWSEGRSENVSRSGLLFSGSTTMESGKVVEVVLEMPVEVSGQAGSNVLCFGTVVRSTPNQGGDKFQIALSVSGYEFLQSMRTA